MMRRTLHLLMLASAVACAGRLYSASTAGSTLAPDTAYKCVQDQLAKMGYKRVRYDNSERWFVAQKVDDAAQVSDIQFRKRLNRLDIHARPDANGGTTLEIKAQTFDQIGNQQGVSESEISASGLVKQDAQTVIEICGK